MPKLAGTPGKPVVHLWGRLTTATESERRLRKHPLVRWICRTYEAQPNVSQAMPDNASNVTGLPWHEAAARRIGEHAQAQVNLGADPATLGFFIQNFADFFGTTPELCIAEDDRVTSTGRKPRSAIFSARSRLGPLTIENTKTPNATQSALYREALKVELQARSIGALGHWIGDSERGHEPWEWCTGSTPFGIWNDMVADARASTEVIAFAQHRVSGGGDATLSQMIAEIVARQPTFSPVFNANWSTGANANFARELLRLRTDCFQSQYASVTRDIWQLDPFWANLKYSNYQMQGQTDPLYPMTLPESGTPAAEHVCGFFGLNVHAPVCYAQTLPNGSPDPQWVRLSPGQRAGPGRVYDEMQVFNQARRQMHACANGLFGNLPICPWLRGIDIGDPTNTPNPSLTPADLAQLVRIVATWPQCTEVIWWYGDNPGVGGDHPAMLEAIQLLYPEWTWNAGIEDWVTT